MRPNDSLLPPRLLSGLASVVGLLGLILVLRLFAPHQDTMTPHPQPNLLTPTGMPTP